ncbi:unnamed protein product [Angiostrongylus costaricensis]|uniref:RRM domain-containing protein n=1 Tax=Angiostrongylus costaricensis TaxID=334426 RepID=A0A0R3PPL6_ANGCS|nr:unnamed protein product [Angiostrongylus costaricensis]
MRARRQNFVSRGMSRRAPPPIEGLYSLKVDNISYNTTQADLRRMFDKYGEIGDIHIPRDKYTRQSKGFGFVRFYSRRDAEYAMDRTDGRWVEGREIRVAMARYERPIDERGSYTRRGSCLQSRLKQSPSISSPESRCAAVQCSISAEHHFGVQILAVSIYGAERTSSYCRLHGRPDPSY